ncbi:heat stress transcription factor A-9-like [Lycium ferocissimum]|uniref:heat stress transcription factor A-9-like n=1 Tax=Lycium ferocissimum TaxID=112874 RepID=UPI0028157C02|nr:heat stress transcription factor A-9-like [Lycium ferocissimum]
MSSFIYQLNNYKFKKIGLQTWEYENYWFQAEKKHLLTNIKRRRNKSLKKDFNQETYYYWVEEELRSQRDLNDTLKLEIKKLKERQDDMTNGIASLKEYLENSEAESRKLLCFLAKKVKQVAIKHGMKCGAEDKIESSSKSSGKTKMDDFSSIKQVHVIALKPEIERGSG